jgi:hypothetical protein
MRGFATGVLGPRAGTPPEDHMIRDRRAMIDPNDRMCAYSRSTNKKQIAPLIGMGDGASN